MKFEELIYSYNVNEHKMRFMLRALRCAEKEMTEREKSFVLNNISKVGDWSTTENMPIATSNKINGKVYVTIDFDRLATFTAMTYGSGGNYNKRLGIVTAYHLIHEASHNISPSEEFAFKNTQRFLLRKYREKPSSFINDLIYADRKGLEKSTQELKE